MSRKLRLGVIVPPTLLIIFSLILNFVNKDKFLNTLNYLNNQILDNFGVTFSIVALIVVILCLILLIHPFSKTKIGGEDAIPLFERHTWFGIALCTGVAAGVLFWAISEPLYHMTSPPLFLKDSSSNSLGVFALSTMYLHWSFTPFALYTIPAVLFAYLYYNKNLNNSLGIILDPLLKNGVGKDDNKLSNIIDTIALYVLIPGMASSIATGSLTISGGINYLTNLKTSPILLFFITLVIIVTFITSCVTGLTNGIKKLSNMNVLLFLILMVIILFSLNLSEVFGIGRLGIVDYFSNFIEKSVFPSMEKHDTWGKSWTVFYWSNWMAWAPITAMFLGRISYGYTIREAVLINFIFPALFSIVWITLFSGSVISFELKNGLLGNILKNEGPEIVVYKYLELLPVSKIIIPLFLIIILMSIVTACDSTTSAMANLSYKGIKNAEDEASTGVKIFWGMLIGVLSILMLSVTGIDGIKILSNLGGVLGVIIQIISIFSLGKLLFSLKKL